MPWLRLPNCFGQRSWLEMIWLHIVQLSRTTINRKFTEQDPVARRLKWLSNSLCVPDDMAHSRSYIFEHLTLLWEDRATMGRRQVIKRCGALLKQASASETLSASSSANQATVPIFKLRPSDAGFQRYLSSLAVSSSAVGICSSLSKHLST